MRVYKYLDIEGALATIKGKSVLLKRPDEFNDPFDCKFYISRAERKNAYRLFVNYQLFKQFYKGIVIENKTLVLGKADTSLFKKNLENTFKIVKKTMIYKMAPEVSFLYKVGKLITGFKDDEVLKQFNETIDTVMESIRKAFLVSCFSSKNNSMLMWSHYAESHKGACFEFEVGDKDFKKVKYSKKMYRFRLTDVLKLVLGHELAETEINYEDESLLFAIEPVFHKTIEWKYEKEFRCVFSLTKHDSRINEHKYQEKKIWLLDMPKNIKAIYVGYNSSDDFVNEIRKHAGNIPIMKMNNCDGENKLLPRKID